MKFLKTKSFNKMESKLKMRGRRKTNRFKDMTNLALIGAPMVLAVACMPEDFSFRPDASTSADVLDLNILDANNDSAVDPFEALDTLLVVEKEVGHAPSHKELEAFLAAQEKEALQEFKKLIAEFDKNQNGVLEKQELEAIEEEEAAWYFEAMDADKDGAVTGEEALRFDFASALLASEEDIQRNLDELFNEKDADKDGVIDLLTEIGEDALDRFSEYDINRDKMISREEAYRYMKADNVPATFTVEGDTAYMEGVITAALPATVLRLLFEHPAVTTIEMLIVPGSIDDEANLRAALYVRKHGLSTRLNANSAIASGGTDFFLAGVTRTVAKGATIGVHSWGGPLTATEVPRDDPIHQGYLDYYEAIGIPAEFYWYTLEAAPAEDIHLMTEEEIDRYKVRTAPAAP